MSAGGGQRDHFTRLALVVVGGLYLGVGFGLTDDSYIFATLFDAAPHLYDAMFVLTGVSCFAWAVVPYSRRAYIASFLLCVGAAASRAMGLLFIEEAVPPAMNWLLTLLLTFLLWPRLMTELRG